MSRDPFANLEPLVQRVYAYAAYRIGDDALADAITKATFERGMRHRAAFDPKTDEPVLWLLDLCRHVIRERNAGFHGTEPLEDAERELVALRFGADLSVEETARILGISPERVAAETARVLDKLGGRPTVPS